MKINAKVNFHNRFDIELRDAETFELKKTGYAENIILNAMYSRVCSGSSYFNNIHFGSGSGELSPARTGLFNHLGTRPASLFETITAFPVSKITRSITLAPEEYAGATLTEVGIAYGSASTNLVTHAMIKDSEGNPLSLEKTDLDVLIIYATVFISFGDEFAETSEGIPLILGYFFSGKAINLDVGVSYTDHPHVYTSEYWKALSKSANVAQKKIVYSTRIPIDEWNIGRQIKVIGAGSRATNTSDFRHHCLFKLRDFNPSVSVLDSYIIGVGDGETDVFDIPKVQLSAPVVTLDGVATADYTLYDAPDREYIAEWIDFERDSINGYAFKQYGITSGPLITASIRYEGITCRGFIKNPQDLIGKSIWYINEDVSIGEIKLRKPGSDSFVSVLNSRFAAKEFLITEEYEEIILKASFYWGNTEVRTVRPGYFFVDTKKQYKLVFTTPPPVGAEIALSGNYVGLLKNSDYVIDFTFELIFGEGV